MVACKGSMGVRYSILLMSSIATWSEMAAAKSLVSALQFNSHTMVF